MSLYIFSIGKFQFEIISTLLKWHWESPYIEQIIFKAFCFRDTLQIICSYSNKEYTQDVRCWDLALCRDLGLWACPCVACVAEIISGWTERCKPSKPGAGEAVNPTGKPRWSGHTSTSPNMAPPWNWQSALSF